MKMTPEQTDRAHQEAVWAASRALERGENQAGAVAAAVAVIEAAKAAAKALDKP